MSNGTPWNPAWDVVSAEIAAWVLENAIPPKGLECPSCTARTVKYRRKLNRGMVLSMFALRDMSRKVNNSESMGWVPIGKRYGTPAKVTTWFGHRELAKLIWWGFVKTQRVSPEDTHSRTGIWRLTPTALAFMRNETNALSWHLVMHGKVIESSKELINVHTAYEEVFDYHKLIERHTDDPTNWPLRKPKFPPPALGLGD